MQTATYYFQQAKECRIKADQARDPDEREYWLRMVQEWLILAERAEHAPTLH